MLKSGELPDCLYPKQPILIRPNIPTPKHSLYLSNLDDQKFLRFSIKYLYLFRHSLNSDSLKHSLSKVLVDYYPLAGRLRTSAQDDQKIEVDCNGEGAVFAEAFMDITSQEFLELSSKPNRSWRKLLYRVEALTFLDVPPLVVQVRLITLSSSSSLLFSYIFFSHLHLLFFVFSFPCQSFFHCEPYQCFLYKTIFNSYELFIYLFFLAFKPLYLPAHLT